MLSAVDTGSGRVMWRIRVGSRPHNLDATGDGLLVVATQGSRSVSIINPRADPAVRRIGLGVPPHDVAARPGGDTVFVLSESGLLAELNPSSGQIVRRVELEGRPHDVAAWRDTAWVTDTSAPRIFVVEGETAKALPISIRGHAPAVRPGTNELWITAWNDRRVAIVDLESRREIEGFAVGQSATHKHLAFTEDGSQAWISEPESGSLFIVDAQTRRLIQRIGLEGQPHHVRFSGGLAYVAVAPRSLFVIDARTRVIVRRITAGTGVHDVVIAAAQ